MEDYKLSDFSNTEIAQAVDFVDMMSEGFEGDELAMWNRVKEMIIHAATDFREIDG